MAAKSIKSVPTYPPSPYLDRHSRWPKTCSQSHGSGPRSHSSSLSSSSSFASISFPASFLSSSLTTFAFLYSFGRAVEVSPSLVHSFAVMPDDLWGSLVHGALHRGHKPVEAGERKELRFLSLSDVGPFTASGTTFHSLAEERRTKKYTRRSISPNVVFITSSKIRKILVEKTEKIK